MSGKKSDDGREWTGTDLVDRHKVVLALDRIKMRGDETWYDYYHKALDAIAKLPSVDAVPVVRCGECKHMTATGRCTEFADDHIKPNASDFCVCGERRKDG